MSDVKLVDGVPWRFKSLHGRGYHQWVIIEKVSNKADVRRYSYAEWISCEEYKTKA